MRHTDIMLLGKEVAVWFGANAGSSGMPYWPLQSYFRPCF